MSILFWTWVCLLAPSVGAGLARLCVKPAYYFNILGMVFAWVASIMMLCLLDTNYINTYVYTWLSAGVSFDFGFWIDALSIYMAIIVTTISLGVHIYSIGYMEGDPSINRYF